MAGAERERESLGKLLVSGLERITTLRNISTNETQDAGHRSPCRLQQKCPGYSPR